MYTIASANAVDGFSKPEIIPSITSLVDELSPDIMVFPEGYQEGHTEHLDAVAEDFERMGYTLHATDYNDADDRHDRHGLVVVHNSNLNVQLHAQRLATRTIMQLFVSNEADEDTIQFFGAHLDDRFETRRTGMVTALAESLWDHYPIVLAGDLNATHRQDIMPSMLRLARPLVGLLPAKDPLPASERAQFSAAERLAYKAGRMGSLAQRLSQMATGTTIALLESFDLTDADTQHTATMPAKLPLVQLDHIMTRDLAVTGFQTFKTDFSDHLGITAKVSLK